MSSVLTVLNISKEDNSHMVSCLHFSFSRLTDREMKKEIEGATGAAM